jgi:hypothetical protein
MQISFCSVNLKGDHLRELGIDEGIILKEIRNKYYMKVWIVSIWFRIRTSGGALMRGAMNLQFPVEPGNLMIG